MEYVALVVVAALLQFFYFALNVGKARGTYEVEAPAVSGHPTFDRHYRVQMNTQEQLMMFLPAIVLFAYWVRPDVAAGLGVVYLIGRALYAKSYIDDPKKRGLGFGLTILPSLVMLIGGAVGAVMSLL
jgi:glutathione S-transferase